MRTYLKLKFQRIMPVFKKPDDIEILNYKISSYDMDSINLLFQEIFICQQYFFETKLKTPFIIDCGSHIGMSIIYFKALYPQSQILAFEPAPNNFKFLSKNVKENNLENIILMNKAVSNEEGKMTFYGDDSLTSSLFREQGGKEIEIEVTKLSNFIDRTVDFLKIDIEGAESLVLENLAAENKLIMVRQMIIEYHHHIIKDVDVLSKFLKILEDNNFGYQIVGSTGPPYKKMKFQDIMIYAYQK